MYHAQPFTNSLQSFEPTCREPQGRTRGSRRAFSLNNLNSYFDLKNYLVRAGAVEIGYARTRRPGRIGDGRIIHGEN